jgi:hypothetical protein
MVIEFSISSRMVEFGCSMFMCCAFVGSTMRGGF